MTKKETKDDSPRNNDDGLKELYERQKNEIIRRKLDTKEIEKDSVVKAREEIVKEVVNRKDKKCNSLREKIEERLELIERSIIDTQNDSLTELTKKMKILNTPLQIDRKRDSSFKYY